MCHPFPATTQQLAFSTTGLLALTYSRKRIVLQLVQRRRSLHRYLRPRGAGFPRVSRVLSNSSCSASCLGLGCMDSAADPVIPRPSPSIGDFP